MSEVFIAIGVLGAVALGAGSIYFFNKDSNTNTNPYDLTGPEYSGNTRGYFNQWNPTSKVDPPYHPDYNRGGTKRKRSKKITTKRHKK
jgi:hypothetical protein